MQIKQKHILFIVVAIALLAYIIWPKGDNLKFARVQKGLFQTTIVEKGEIRASVTEDIMAPHSTVKDGKFLPPMKILELVPEGTIVKTGDKVAVLDPTQVVQTMSNIEMRSYNINQQIEQSRLDSSLSLTEARSAIDKTREQLIDARLRIDQSKYESKSVQRQEQITLEKTQRQLNSQLRNYDQKQRSFKAQIEREQRFIARFEKQVDAYRSLMSKTIVTAPANGMVIYADKFGAKTQVGSNVSGWQPAIASLPDLRHINSTVMINETEISKVKVGQNVNITVEALPGRTFTGQIVKIAHIGQELTDQYQIAFPVEIKVDVPQKEPPFELMPNMTSTNTIITSQWDNALFIDKTCIHSNDSSYFVYKKKGTSYKKHNVSIGAENENYIQILEGVEEDDKVLL